MNVPNLLRTDDFLGITYYLILGLIALQFGDKMFKKGEQLLARAAQKEELNV